MKYPLFSRVALAADYPAEEIRRGDVATIADYHLAPAGTVEPGYSIEVFNAVGRTVAVLNVPESHLEPLRDDEVLSVRPRTSHAV
jgi:hypothetical protein